MPQIHSSATIKKLIKNPIITAAQKHKKKALPLALTPLLAACEITSIPTKAPDNDALITAGYTVYRGVSFGGDIYTGTDSKDAIIGGIGDDIFTSGAGDDLIYGNEGNDIINAGTGADEIYGGDGDDYISPGTDLNYDYIDGGAGVDTVSYFTHFGKLEIDLESGDVLINGGLEDDVVNIENVDGVLNATNVIYGNKADNLLSGGNYNDKIFGRDGNDVLEGLDGHDELDGGKGNDVLQGGNGDDILVGGQGNDMFYGGAGNDVFKFSDQDIAGAVSNDVIYDFNILDDFIDFSGLSFISDFGDLILNTVQNGNDVEIFMHAFDDYIVKLENVDLTQLSASDFIFV